MSKPVVYFAYGSNLDDAQMRTRCPSAVPGAKATLPRHRLIFCGHCRGWGGGVASLVRDGRSAFAGRLYRLQLADLARLDRFEGCPAAYRRVHRVVKLANERRV
jgi:hypothetical protein